MLARAECVCLFSGADACVCLFVCLCVRAREEILEGNCSTSTEAVGNFGLNSIAECEILEGTCIGSRWGCQYERVACYLCAHLSSVFCL